MPSVPSAIAGRRPAVLPAASADSEATPSATLRPTAPPLATAEPAQYVRCGWG